MLLYQRLLTIYLFNFTVKHKDKHFNFALKCKMFHFTFKHKHKIILSNFII